MKRYWCKEDELTLVTMANEGKTNTEIAEALGRSRTSVAHKRARLFAAAEPAVTNERLTTEEGELEDPDEEGSTELERELRFTQRLLDEATASIRANAELFNSNMAAFMECVSALSKDNTVLRDKAAAQEKDLSELSDKCSCMEEYLAHGALWRLFHSFRKYMEARR